MLLLIIMVIITNALMIPLWGMTGAAIASLISMAVFTILTVVILWKNYRLWPFSLIHIKALMVAIAIFIVSTLIPQMPLYIDVVVRSVIITVLFLSAVLFLDLSDEGSEIFRKITGNVRRS